MDEKQPADKPAMYKLINPDPLRRKTARALAAQAKCAIGTVSDLRNGRIDSASGRIASGIAQALGVTIDSLWKPLGRTAWDRQHEHHE